MISKTDLLKLNTFITTFFDESDLTFRYGMPLLGSIIGVVNPPLSSLAVSRIISKMAHDSITFSEYLFQLIRQNNIDEKKLYIAIGKDHKYLSKIRCNKNYQPSKKIVCAMAISMRLTLTETNMLLQLAGYALSTSQHFDLIISYAIINKIYDISIVQDYLEEYGLSF